MLNMLYFSEDKKNSDLLIPSGNSSLNDKFCFLSSVRNFDTTVPETCNKTFSILRNQASGSKILPDYKLRQSITEWAWKDWSPKVALEGYGQF